ncbi:MAG TPA: hypothetical protein VFQ23_00405 [Anaerolineales bacterium]|nr:hypothetical protein [Anaerolineales bacterium]
MKTLDLKKELKHLYAPSSKSPEIVQVPCLQFAMIDGVIEKGLCMQMKHIKPYATEPLTINRMRAVAYENGRRDNVGPNGKHHEIYIGDPRKADPAKLKTVVRHPLEKVT